MDENLDEKVKQAVQHFWKTRSQQAKTQGAKKGQKDKGSRADVTGGKHLDGFVNLCRELLIGAGLTEADIYWKSKRELPGFFRAEKSWDLVVVSGVSVVAVIECKAQVGPSFSNNFNNRAEEMLGCATDFWTAYREGASEPSPRPWLGYLFLLEDTTRSQSPVKVAEPHYPVFPDFVEASYAKRYELLLLRLLRERLYDGACLLLSQKKDASTGHYTCPNNELTFLRFARSLTTHASVFSKMQDLS